jgi:hypothetical protein
MNIHDVLEIKIDGAKEGVALDECRGNLDLLMDIML